MLEPPHFQWDADPTEREGGAEGPGGSLLAQAGKAFGRPDFLDFAPQFVAAKAIEESLLVRPASLDLAHDSTPSPLSLVIQQVLSQPRSSEDIDLTSLNTAVSMADGWSYWPIH